MNKKWQSFQRVWTCSFSAARKEGNVKKRKDRRLVKTNGRSVVRLGRRACPRLPGSVVVEAALVLPLYLYFSVLITQLILLPGVKLRVRQALYEDARILAESAYACRKAGERLGTSPDDSDYEEEAADKLSVAAASVLLLGQLGPDYGGRHGIVGGTAGILLLNSEIAEEDNDITLRAVYEVKLPFYDIFRQSLIVRETVMTSAWLGESGEKEDRGYENENEEETVYITENGEVYHLDRNCTYIEVTLQETDLEDVDAMRSASGHKYHPCEVCAGREGVQTGQRLYVTRYGKRYHTRADCPAIERYVREIPASEAGNRRPCSKCGN